MILSKMNRACVRIHDELKRTYAIVPTPKQIRMAMIYNVAGYNKQWDDDIAHEFASYTTNMPMLETMTNMFDEIKY